MVGVQISSLLVNKVFLIFKIQIKINRETHKAHHLIGIMKETMKKRRFKGSIIILHLKK